MIRDAIVEACSRGVITDNLIAVLDQQDLFVIATSLAMRLINTKSLLLEEFSSTPGEEYAILSHRWRNDEVTFHDMISKTGRKKRGYAKIVACCKQAMADRLSYVWVDTCCIDKTSSAELSEAVNSMYKWYASAKLCYAYLDDVSSPEGIDESEWFTRGWTLQELIAPSEVIFYNVRWMDIGSKKNMADQLARVTGIDYAVLLGAHPSTCSFAQRMAWASQRLTTRIEDTTYCLLGLFGVNMALLYGEGERAFIRLQEELVKLSDDNSIFAWSNPGYESNGLLANSPNAFEGCHDVVRVSWKDLPYIAPQEPYMITNRGLSIQFSLLQRPRALETFVALLNCGRRGAPKNQIGIFLKHTDHNDHRSASRTTIDGTDRTSIEENVQTMIKRFFVPQYNFQHDAITRLQGFLVQSIQAPCIQSSIPYSRDFKCQGPNVSAHLHTLVSMKHTSFGTAGTIELLDETTTIAAVKLGFDSQFRPVCRVYDRDNSQKIKNSTLGITDFSWADEKIDSHPGSQELQVPYYRVVRERGSYYFGMPEYLFASDHWSLEESMASSKEPALCAIIKKLKVRIEIKRRIYHNLLFWNITIEPSSSPSKYPYLTPTIIDESPEKDTWNPTHDGMGFIRGSEWAQISTSKRSPGPTAPPAY